MRRILKWLLIATIAVSFLLLVNVLVFGVGSDEPGGGVGVLTQQ